MDFVHDCNVEKNRINLTEKWSFPLIHPVKKKKKVSLHISLGIFALKVDFQGRLDNLDFAVLD